MYLNELRCSVDIRLRFIYYIQSVRDRKYINTRREYKRFSIADSVRHHRNANCSFRYHVQVKYYIVLFFKYYFIIIIIIIIGYSPVAVLKTSSDCTLNPISLWALTSTL